MSTALLTISNQTMILHPLKAMFWQEQRMLICCDIHIGKAAHFRKSGIAIPTRVNQHNFWNLSFLFDEFEPKTMLVLGDMVHSQVNSEWSDFADFLDNYPSIDRWLVRGNHELFPDARYESLGFKVFRELKMEGLHFTHEPSADSSADFNLYGHVHPAVRMEGAGLRAIKLPCFYLGRNALALPSFGSFTGSHVVVPKRGEKVYVIADQAIREISI